MASLPSQRVYCGGTGSPLVLWAALRGVKRVFPRALTDEAQPDGSDGLTGLVESG